MKSGLVLIRNNCHNLFRQLYGIPYDQVGFVHEGYMSLYWIIPTESASYRGPEKKFHINGCIISYAALGPRCSKKKFEEALRLLDSPITIPFSQQYEQKTPVGLAYINEVLTFMGAVNCSPHYLSLSGILSLFMPQVIYKEERSETPVFCDDLLRMIIRRPELLFVDREQRLKGLAKQAAKSLLELTLIITQDQKIIPMQQWRNYHSLAVNIYDCLLMGLPSDESQFPEDGENNDHLVIVTGDGSIKDSVNTLRDLVKHMIEGQRRLEFSDFLQVCNHIFRLFGLSALELPNEHLPFSFFVAVTTEKEKVTFTTVDEEEKESTQSEKVISLNGHGLQDLNAGEVRRLLEALALYDDHPEFDYLRAVATKQYYTLHQSIQKSKDF